jgi:hypothetical protein
MMKNNGMVKQIFMLEGIMILFVILSSVFIWKTFQEY